MTREWFTTYCQNAAANVLDKDGKVRFTYTELKVSLDAASEHNVAGIDGAVLALHNNLVDLSHKRNPGQNLNMTDNQEYTLLLTLLNIHAAYLMISGLWIEEPLKAEGVDEYGFEIF